jgi:hypothetical protein
MSDMFCDKPREYFPRTKHPSAEQGADDLPTPNVDVARAQRGHIVPGAQGIGRDVRA